MSVGKRIKDLRNTKSISQTELADKIDISKQTLYKYENSIVSNIPSDKIEKIADVLGTTPAYLMGWTEDSFEPIPNMADRKNDIYFSMNQMREILLDDEVAALYKGEVLSNGKRQTILTVLDSIDGIAQIK